RAEVSSPMPESYDVCHPARIGRNAHDWTVGVWVVLCRTSVSAGLQKLVLVRVCGRRRARRQIELVEDVAHMTGDGLLADIQPIGDGPVGSTGCNEPEYFDLASGEIRCERRL